MDKHKDICEYQQIHCPYYDMGCNTEVLRKDALDHLHEHAFAHSIIFIEGQKKKNKEIDELKQELVSLRQCYDVEIQAMFLELNRLKEDVHQINGGATRNKNPLVNVGLSSSVLVSNHDRMHRNGNE